jgi:hypothetical protein
MAREDEALQKAASRKFLGVFFCFEFFVLHSFWPMFSLFLL